MFSWKRLGNFFNPVVSRPRPWMQEYAQCPTPLVLNEHVLRVFIASRPRPGSDMQYVSYPGYVDLARNDISKVLAVAESPLLPLGDTGCFDEFGIMPSSIVRQGEKLYAYYSGWTRMASVPYTLSIGVAVSHDGGLSFERLGDGPILGPGLHEPYFVTGPSVKIIDDLWHMWYLTGKDWLILDNKPQPIYQVAHATSDDGITWLRDGATVLPTLAEHECQDIFSPFFLDGKWHAIFAWRNPVSSDDAYRLGYASSSDLQHWTRDDIQAGIELSPTGWDSQMMCYPSILELDGRILMFYCGNQFGREGFGIAEMTNHHSSR